MTTPVPKDDKWAFIQNGEQFPENCVNAFGRQNIYIALSYKNGEPIHGYAWNNVGILQASFPHANAELTGADMDGMIQLLQYVGDHNTLGYWYEWINYKDRFEKTDKRQLVRCGDSMPILWVNRPGGALLGNLNTKSYKIITRNLVGGPGDCGCDVCLADKLRDEYQREEMGNEADVGEEEGTGREPTEESTSREDDYGTLAELDLSFLQRNEE